MTSWNLWTNEWDRKKIVLSEVTHIQKDKHSVLWSGYEEWRMESFSSWLWMPESCILHFPRSWLIFIPTSPNSWRYYPSLLWFEYKLPPPPQQACVLKAWFSVSRHNHWGRWSKNTDFMNGLFVCDGIIGREQKVGGGAWLEKVCHWGCPLKGKSCPRPSLYLLFASWVP